MGNFLKIPETRLALSDTYFFLLWNSAFFMQNLAKFVLTKLVLGLFKRSVQGT